MDPVTFIKQNVMKWSIANFYHSLFQLTKMIVNLVLNFILVCSSDESPRMNNEHIPLNLFAQFPYT